MPSACAGRRPNGQAVRSNTVYTWYIKSIKYRGVVHVATVVAREAPMDPVDWLWLHVRPERSALLVIDVQNDFCAPHGWYDRIGNDRTAVDPAVGAIDALLPIARAAGMLVVFLRCIYGPEFLSPRLAEAWQHKGLPADALVGGSWGAEFYRIAPEPGDLVLTKHHYSAFVRTELEAALQARGVQNVVLAGVATNVCVDSTARDACMLGYRVAVLSDCCASYDDGLHRATLDNVRRVLGIVLSSSDLTDALAAHRR